MTTGIMRDARFALRVLRREWRTTVLTIACLGIGIGATTAMFSVADVLLLRALPFPNGDRMFDVSTRRRGSAESQPTSYEDYLDWRARQRSFAQLAAYGTTTFPVVLKEPVRVRAALVSANFFGVLGVKPLRGRAFVDGEDRVDAAPVVIVSRGLAERELGGVDEAVGKVIDVHGLPRTIVGVVPEEQMMPPDWEMWLPFPRDLDAGRGNRNLEVVGVLRPGVSMHGAEADLQAIEAELASTFPREDKGLSVSLAPLRERFLSPARESLYAMVAAAALVLLVTGANVGGIQLARATARVHEITLRRAIGATRGQIVRQLLTESVTLSALGGALGLFIATRSSLLAFRSVYGAVPSWLEPALDWRVFTFSLVASLAAGIAFGIAPAVRLARTDASAVLRGGRGTLGPQRGRMLQTFVVMQIAASVVLAVAAQLAVQSALRAQRTPLGFDADGVLIFALSTQNKRYDDAPRERVQFVENLVSRIARLPGVVGAGAASMTPLRCCSRWPIHIAGRPSDERLVVMGHSVTPGYLETMRIPVLRGRSFARADDRASEPVMIINETFATRYWPNANPIGGVIVDGDDRATIVGVVADVKQGNVTDAPEAQFYRPVAQKPSTTLTFTVRIATGDPTILVPWIRKVVRELDPAMPIYNVGTMRSRVDTALLRGRTFGTLMLLFGGVAMLLACLGVFAVASFFVALRTRELGVRVALGAAPSDLVAVVVKGTARMAVIGGILGFVGAIIAARWLAHTLYGVSAGQLGLFALAALLLAAVTAAASYGPARRAASADPMAAMRAE